MNLPALYARTPRAARWAFLASLGIVLYFGLVEPALDARARAAARAEALANQLDQERLLAASAQSIPAALAAPALPRPAAEAKQALYERVNTILAEHGVSADRSERLAALVPNPAIADLVSPGQSLERLIIDLTFEAAPEVITAVVADLEAAPEVTALARVSLRRAESRAGGGASGRVRAIVSPETWVLVEKRR
ncbi:MAG TPA: hypothetical protein VD963_04270 [Phycisphaerales bacterium]|nr:hypothetical protein [Phycisphaerales bacterium]